MVSFTTYFISKLRHVLKSILDIYPNSTQIISMLLTNSDYYLVESMLQNAIRNTVYSTETLSSISFSSLFSKMGYMFEMIGIAFLVASLIVYATVIIPFMQKISINRWKLHYLVSYIRIDILQQNKQFLTYIEELEKNKSN